MEKNGHEFIITNRDQKIINDLLDAYGIKHIIRNKRPEKSNFIASILYITSCIILISKAVRNRKVDLYLGFASFPCSFLSFLYRKPSILIDDTEHNKTNHLLYKYFCSVILTPFYFAKNMGKKQIYFNAYVEQLYLNSKYFNPQLQAFNQNNVLSEEYILVRFISYTARHDNVVRNRLSLEEKKDIIRTLSEKSKVYVSLEEDTTEVFFDQFKITIEPDQMHALIAHANLLITEGATMACEAGILGINYYYINPLKVGNVNEQSTKYPNAHQCNGNQLLANLKATNKTQMNTLEIRSQIERETIDPTEFLIWFIENYPESFKIMKDNPDYQLRFK